MIGLCDVSVTYAAGKAALKRTTIAFAAGEFAVLLGPSGAGKSTLLRTLNCLVPATTGYVTVEGIGRVDTGAKLREHRRRTAFVFQQHQLIGRISVLDNVLTGRLGYHGALRSLFPLPVRDHRLAMECLDRVSLSDRALDRADTLSGGQQQRVGLARALAQQPRLMLADEPVASLDPATAHRTLQLLHDICRAEGIAAIVSLHQVDLARSFADRIVGIAQGGIVFDGPLDQLSDANLDRVYDTPPTFAARSEPVAGLSLAPVTMES
jgi:phosphonate transport system ATP-binding protein